MAGGLLVVAVSVAVFAVLGVDDGLGPVIVALVLSGIGQAFVFNVSNIAAVDAAVGAAGLESGMINEVRQIGALVGLAVFGALFAALQAAGQGSADAVFVDALRLPNLILAAVCVLAAAYVVRARVRTGRARPADSCPRVAGSRTAPGARRAVGRRSRSGRCRARPRGTRCRDGARRRSVRSRRGPRGCPARAIATFLPATRVMVEFWNSPSVITSWTKPFGSPIAAAMNAKTSISPSGVGG